MSKQWVSYSLAMQELGTASETMIALHMLDKTSPEQTREYLTTKLAFQVQALDMMTKYDASQKDELANGLFLKVAQHKKEHPFTIKDPELNEKLNAILAEAESGSQKDKSGSNKRVQRTRHKVSGPLTRDVRLKTCIN